MVFGYYAVVVFFFVSRVFWVVARRRLCGFVVLCSEWLLGRH